MSKPESTLRKLSSISESTLKKNIKYLLLRIDRIIKTPKNDDKIMAKMHIPEDEEEDENEPVITKLYVKLDDSKAKNEEIKSKFEALPYKEDTNIDGHIMNIFKYLCSIDREFNAINKVYELMNSIKLFLFGPSSLENRKRPVNIDPIYIKAYLCLVFQYKSDDILEILNDDRLTKKQKATLINNFFIKVNKSIIDNINNTDKSLIYPLVLLMLMIMRGFKYGNLRREFTTAEDILSTLYNHIKDTFDGIKDKARDSVIFTLLNNGVPDDKPKDDKKEEEEQAEPTVEAPATTAEPPPTVEAPVTTPSVTTAPPPTVEGEPAPPPTEEEEQAEPTPPSDISDAQGNGELIEDVQAMTEQATVAREQQNQQEAALTLDAVISKEPSDPRLKVNYYLNYMNQFINDIQSAQTVNNNELFDVIHSVMKRIFDLFIGNNNIIYSSILGGIKFFENQENIPYITPDNVIYNTSLSIGDFLRVYDTVAASFNSKVNNTQKEGLVLPIQEIPIYYRVILRNGRIIGLVPTDGGVGSYNMNSSMLNMEKNKIVASLLNSGDLSIVSQTPKIDITTGQILLDPLGQPLYNTIYSYKGINITDEDLHKLILNSLARDFIRLTGPVLSEAEMRVLRSKQNYKGMNENITRKGAISNLNRLPLNGSVSKKTSEGSVRSTSSYNKRAYVEQFII